MAFTILPWCIHTLALLNSCRASSFNKCLCSIGYQWNIRYVLKELRAKLIGTREFVNWKTFDIKFSIHLLACRDGCFTITFHSTSLGDQTCNQNPVIHYFVQFTYSNLNSDHPRSTAATKYRHYECCESSATLRATHSHLQSTQVCESKTER